MKKLSNQKFIQCIILLPFLLGCNQNYQSENALNMDNKIITDLPDMKHINGEIVDVEILGLYNAVCADSLLIARCQNSGSFFIYNINTLEFLGKNI